MRLRSSTYGQSQKRRGVAILIVISILTLIAIVGVSFVYFSDSQQIAARYFKESDYDRFRSSSGGGGGGGGGNDRPPSIPCSLLINWSMSQLIYDVNDDIHGAASALRGHSLARSMYGYNDQTLNVVPFNGVGRLEFQHPNQNNRLFKTFEGLSDRPLINYQFHENRNDQTGALVRDAIRDPERYGSRDTLNDPRPVHTGGYNVSYTYPDENNLFLAAVNADGYVITPSFHREWISGVPANVIASQNTAAGQNPLGKYQVLFPRQREMTANFEPPTRYGHVKQLDGAPGGNDSFFMDLGYPVQVADDGRKFKPLFAFLVVDLDNRINANYHGNMMTGGLPGDHGSNMGLGPWEVNPKYVLRGDSPNNLANAIEWKNLFIGKDLIPGRYGLGPNAVPQSAPPNPPSADPGKQRRFLAQWDMDGDAEDRLRLPGEIQGTGSQINPVFNFNASQQTGYENGGLNEPLRHASLFDPQRPEGDYLRDNNGNFVRDNNGNYIPRWDDRAFGLQNVKLLLAHAFQGNEALSSELAQLCPVSFGGIPNLPTTAAHIKVRNLITTASWDVNRPSISPWLYDRSAHPYQRASWNPLLPPVGQAVNFPANNLNDRFTRAVPQHSDFRTPGGAVADPQADWRGFRGLLNVANVPNASLSDPRVQQVYAALQRRMDLNRKLTSYPHQDYEGKNLDSAAQVALFHSSYAANNARYLQAKAERELFAEEIYRNLLLITGTRPPTANVPQTDAELYPRRWLAQLAVNIVDFIDEDEVSTSFNFLSNHMDGLPVDNVASGVQVSTKPLHDNNTELDIDPIPVGVPLPGGGGNPPEEELIAFQQPQQIPAADRELLPRYWVFGTELPQVVLNEALCEAELPQDTTDPAAVVGIKVWAELFCPLSNAATLRPELQQQDNQPVPLYSQDGNYSIYELVVANGTENGPTALHADSGNSVGAPRSRRATVAFTANVAQVGNGTQRSEIDPKQEEYVIVGPGVKEANDTIKNLPASTKWHKAANLQYQIKYSNGWVPDDTKGVTVLLRRLANPHLPPDHRPVVNNQVNPAYNPYVTIDYIEDVQPQDVKGVPLQSIGKRQPFAAAKTRLAGQGDSNNPKVHTLGQRNTPQQRFDWLVHLDRPLSSPLELLNVSGVPPYHLTQRFITTPNDDLADFGHLVPWFDQDLADQTTEPSHRLYRFFEHVQTHPRGFGIGPNDRVPGKININTIYDKETFYALCDPQRSNAFTAADVDAIWQQMLRMRSLGMNPTQPPDPNLPPVPGNIYRWTVTGGDRPFRGLSEGHLPGNDQQTTVLRGNQVLRRGRNINDTFLRQFDDFDNRSGYVVRGNLPRLFQLPVGRNQASVHPYQRYELMNKLYNQVTTRSNVFAVWVTAALFEVLDDRTSPPRLGKEIGIDEGTNQRCRWFSVIDRTQLQLYGMHFDPVRQTWSERRYLTRSAPNAQGEILMTDPRIAPGIQPLRLESLAGYTNSIRGQVNGAQNPDPDPTRRCIPWIIEPGSFLFVDVGRDREMVQVLSVTPDNPADLTQGGVIHAQFQREHRIFRDTTGQPVQGFEVSMPGNPGPQSNFNRQDSFYSNVIPYLQELK